jgi:membrane fusion protein (multidrug efflux system)
VSQDHKQDRENKKPAGTGEKPEAKTKTQPGRRFSLQRLLPRSIGLKPQHLAAVVLLLLGLVWGGFEIRSRMIHVYEYDARIAGNLITISSRVPGWIDSIQVAEGQKIKAGQVLVQLDAKESELLVQQLKAELEATEATLKSLHARRDLVAKQSESQYQTQVSTLKGATAVVEALKVHREVAQTELERTQDLFAKKVIPRIQLEQAMTRAQQVNVEYHKAVASLQSAEARLDEAAANLNRVQVLDAEGQVLRQRVEQLKRKLDRQKLDFDDRTIRSKIEGVVDKIFVDAGEYVTPAQRLAIIHDPNTVWIEANIKETEVRKLKIGQPVEISVDAFPDLEIAGTVEAIGNSTTSEFALLPTPNPSGNFTKITQRLPIRIKVSQNQDLLRPGMMVEVNIDIRER